MYSISESLLSVQRRLWLAVELRTDCAMTAKLKQAVSLLEFVRVEKFVRSPYSQMFGRREHDRRKIARAYVLKSFFDVPTTKGLREMLVSQPALREICGWELARDVPSEATFSRAFDEFARADLGGNAHLSLVKSHVGNSLVMHVSRDSTAVSARERPAARKQAPQDNPTPKYRRGRPKKGEVRPEPEPKRLDVQLGQSAVEAFADLPRDCGRGVKKDSRGYMHTWIGYKAHIDYADGAVPVNVQTTSACVHDSQVAVPLIKDTASRITSAYALMDSAYDAEQIRQACREAGVVPIIDPNPRRAGVAEDRLLDPAAKLRYNERSTAERGNSRLKDSLGLRHVRVRGHRKVHLHIMFAVLVLFAHQIMKPLNC